ncbi:protein starmaker-like [Symsagittifera roscoffensis]|uniref:protein starmaker-like n=1 Tax=Symsagittifera roscoffensis TaxID=84072 RepID=UPI00307C1E57
MKVFIIKIFLLLALQTGVLVSAQGNEDTAPQIVHTENQKQVNVETDEEIRNSLTEVLSDEPMIQEPVDAKGPQDEPQGSSKTLSPAPTSEQEALEQSSIPASKSTKTDVGAVLVGTASTGIRVENDQANVEISSEGETALRPPPKETEIPPENADIHRHPEKPSEPILHLPVQDNIYKIQVEEKSESGVDEKTAAPTQEKQDGATAEENSESEKDITGGVNVPKNKEDEVKANEANKVQSYENEIMKKEGEEKNDNKDFGDLYVDFDYDDWHDFFNELDLQGDYHYDYSKDQENHKDGDDSDDEDYDYWLGIGGYDEDYKYYDYDYAGNDFKWRWLIDNDYDYEDESGENWNSKTDTPKFQSKKAGDSGAFIAHWALFSILLVGTGLFCYIVFKYYYGYRITHTPLILTGVNSDDDNSYSDRRPIVFFGDDVGKHA